MRRPTARSRSLVLVVTAALVVPLVLAAPILPSTRGPAAAAAGPRPRPVVDSPSIRAKDKIHPKLQRAMTRPRPRRPLRFVARIVPGHLPRPVRRRAGSPGRGSTRWA